MARCGLVISTLRSGLALARSSAKDPNHNQLFVEEAGKFRRLKLPEHAPVLGNRCPLPGKSKLGWTVLFDCWGKLIGITVIFAAIFTGASVISTSALRYVACIRELASIVAFASTAIIGDVYFIHQIIPLVHFEELYRL
jgi:hypothetical protein